MGIGARRIAQSSVLTNFGRLFVNFYPLVRRLIEPDVLDRLIAFAGDAGANAGAAEAG